MALTDLTDPSAILQSVAECDRLGRDKFLSKYGFGAARRYLLVHQNKEYDSKAVIGAAYGYAFPGKGPLRADEFVGGETTVARKLSDLGFEVRDRGPGSNANPHWARDEQIVALDLYLRRRPELPGGRDPEVIAFSDLLSLDPPMSDG